jgi:hypothetical protein
MAESEVATKTNPGGFSEKTQLRTQRVARDATRDSATTKW